MPYTVLRLRLSKPTGGSVRYRE